MGLYVIHTQLICNFHSIGVAEMKMIGSLDTVPILLLYCYHVCGMQFAHQFFICVFDTKDIASMQFTCFINAVCILHVDYVWHVNICRHVVYSMQMLWIGLACSSRQLTYHLLTARIPLSKQLAIQFALFQHVIFKLFMCMQDIFHLLLSCGWHYSCMF